MGIRSIESLAKQFPDKTGKELFEIQAKDKKHEEQRLNRKNKEVLELIEDLNTNGAYYKGTFGLNQYFFYKFTNIKFDERIERTYSDVTEIVCFKNLFEDTKVEMEQREHKSKDISNYGIDSLERVTKEEFDEVSKYLEDIFPKFWKPIDPKS